MESLRRFGGSGLDQDLDGPVIGCRVLKSIELMTLLDSMSEGVLVVDADNCIWFANWRYLELLRLPSDLLSKGDSLSKLTDFLRQRGEYLGEKYVELQNLLRNAQTQPFTFERVRPNGTRLLVRSRPIASGGYVVTVIDVTPLRKVEAPSLEREAPHDGRLMEEREIEPPKRLADSMGHGFNQLLTEICDNLELLLNTLGPEHSQRRHYAQSALEGVRRISQMTAQGLASEPPQQHLPQPGKAKTDDAGADAMAASDRGSGKILLVEDDQFVRHAVSTMLKELGYEVVEASNGPAALDALSSGAEVDLLLTDIGMPGAINGWQLAESVRRRRPGVRVLFSTGYSENEILKNSGSIAPVHLLQKPYTRSTLATKVRKIFMVPA